MESIHNSNESSSIMDVEGLLGKSKNNGRTNILSVLSFSIEGFLRSATLPEKDKEQLVRKYGELLVSNGLSEENQLSLLNFELLKSIGVLPIHAAAIAEAAKNYGKKGS